MPRTTLNIDAPVLQDLKRLQKKAGKSLGRLVSDLLAHAIGRARGVEAAPPLQLAWTARPMQARIDLTDKEAVRAALDEGRPAT